MSHSYGHYIKILSINQSINTFYSCLNDTEKKVYNIYKYKYTIYTMYKAIQSNY